MWLPLWFHVTYFFLSFSFCATCAHIWPYNFSELWPCVGPLIGAQETAELIFWGNSEVKPGGLKREVCRKCTVLWLLYTRLSRPSSPPSLHSECVLGIVYLLPFVPSLCVFVRKKVFELFFYGHLLSTPYLRCVCVDWGEVWGSLSVACSQGKCV